MNIGVVGCGYVGLSTAVALAKENKVHIFDIDPKRINMLNDNIIPFEEVDLERDFFQFRSNIIIEKNRDALINKCSIFILAISTNFDAQNGHLDISGIEAWIKELYICKMKELPLIVIRSTIPIGFIEQMVSKYEYSKIIYWPEFLREGNAYYDVKNPSRVIIGGSNKDTSALMKLIEKNVDNDASVYYVTAKEAETVKLFSNTYLAMRVAFFNELDYFSEKNNMDVHKIIDGICDDTRIGNFYNNPSFGYGGYCLPKDSQQLANILGSDGVLINSVVLSNERRKQNIAKRIAKIGKSIGVYRLQMKKNSDNLRGSAVIDIVSDLVKNGIRVNIYEPLLDGELEVFPGTYIYKDLAEMANDSDLIISNRMYDELLPYYEKLYTRDIYFRD